MKKLKVVQIGTTHEHALGKIKTVELLKDNFEVVGVVDDTYMDTPRFGAYNPIYDKYPKLTLEQALAYPGLDLALVEVPNLELVPIGKMCAERGIPMHLDKPAGETLEPYRELLQICKEKNVPLQMGYMYRGNPALNFIRRLIQKNVIGDVCDVQMDMHHCYGGDTYQDYLGKFKGGIMFNLGCHLIDFVAATFGEPENVVPFLNSTPDVNPAIKNNCLAVLQYPHMSVQLRACSKLSGTGCDVSLRRWSFFGTNGTIEVTPPERFDGERIVVELNIRKDTEHYPAGMHKLAFPPQRDRYEKQLLEMAEIVAEGKKNPYTYEHDLSVHKITLAAAGYISWK